MNDMDDDPVELAEPRPDEADDDSRQIWFRGLWMLVLAALFGLAQTILGVTAIIQFLWMLVAKEKNPLLSDFGRDLGRWLNDVALFQTGATEEKPFPWKPFHQE